MMCIWNVKIVTTQISDDLNFLLDYMRIIIKDKPKSWVCEFYKNAKFVKVIRKLIFSLNLMPFYCCPVENKTVVYFLQNWPCLRGGGGGV